MVCFCKVLIIEIVFFVEIQSNNVVFLCWICFNDFPVEFYSFQDPMLNFIHKNLKELKHLYHSTHVSIEFETLEFKQEVHTLISLRKVTYKIKNRNSNERIRTPIKTERVKNVSNLNFWFQLQWNARDFPALQYLSPF